MWGECGGFADLPSVVAGATALRTGAIADRCAVVGVDFFQAVPERADGLERRGRLGDLEKLPVGYSAQRGAASNRTDSESVQPARSRKVL